MNIQKILSEHQLWLDTDGREGERAGLSSADLCYANLCEINLRVADLNRADLFSADLRKADLNRTNLHKAHLCSANLSNANLYRAILSEVCLWDCTGDGTYIKNIGDLEYSIAYTIDRLQIGCENHSIEEWRNFSDEVISDMDGLEALRFWKENKAKIFEEIESNPALDTGYRE